MHTGSINLTKLIDKAKSKHSSFAKGKNEPHDVFANIIVWENDEQDEQGNNMSITLNSKKEMRENGSEKKAVYIGNLKTVTPRNETVETEDIPESEDVISGNPLDDLPF